MRKMIVALVLIAFFAWLGHHEGAEKKAPPLEYLAQPTPKPEPKKVTRADVPKTEAETVAIRKEMAATLQHEFLMRNMDARFAAEGAKGTTLHMTYVLVGMPLAEQLKTDGSFLERCRFAGFKRVVLDDGFGKTFTFNL